MTTVQHYNTEFIKIATIKRTSSKLGRFVLGDKFHLIMLSLFDCTCYQKELALLIVDEAEFMETAFTVE